MPSSCLDIRSELAKCIQRSDCCLIQRHTPSECLRKKELYAGLPDECHLLQQAYYDCRRGWLDMRKRFRGNAPIRRSNREAEINIADEKNRTL